MADLESRLEDIGITAAMLSGPHLLRLSTLNVKVTNRLMLDLHLYMNKTGGCTYNHLRDWVAALLGTKWPVSNPPTAKALRQSVIRLSSRLAKFKKERKLEVKNALITSFLDEYCLPAVFVSRGKLFKVARATSTSSSSSTDWEKENLKRVNEELTDRSSELEQTEQKLKKLQLRAHSKRRNDRKKIKRRECQLKLKKKEAKEGKQLIRDLQKDLSDQEQSIEQMKKCVDRLRHRAGYWKKKFEASKASNCDEVVNAIAEEKETQERLSDEIDFLECENVELRETVEKFMADNEEIVTFEKSKYKDNIRACCYELLSLNVGVRNVEKVIKSVLHNIAGRSVGRLPCRTTLCEMIIESLTVAQAQLGEKLTEQDSDYFTLHTDGTIKYGEHFGTYVTTKDQTYCLGLRHVFSGSAQTTLDTFLEILDDLDTVCQETGSETVSKTIMCKIKNTMSDRHAAEKLFCQLLADYREDVLPDVVKDWDLLSSAQKLQMTRMNNFFGALHFLVGLAETAEATLTLWETIEGGSQASSSGTQRLIRTASKAFHSRGCEKSGCSVHFRTYLRSQGVNEMPLALFQGNCFNILFYDGAGVYYLKEHFVKYLAEYHHGTLNKLLQAVLADIRAHKHIAGCKALGIIDKLVTGPFWRKLESTTISILNMSSVYSKMKEMCDKWGEDASPVIDEEVYLFPEFTNSEDVVAKKLSEPYVHDTLVQEVLQLIFKAFSTTTKKLVLDHLPGGEYNSVEDPQVAMEIANVPKTNVAPERDFAILDRLLSEKPNANYIALESLLLYSQNKTANWLFSKNEEEKERLISAARSLTAVHRANFVKRRKEIEQRRLQAQLDREREKQKKQEKLVKEKEELTKKLGPLGLWTTTAEIEKGLQAMSKKDKIDALKVQISFRRKVLGQSHEDKTVFFFSHNRKPFDEELLKANLLKLLPQSTPQLTVTEIASDPDLLLYCRIKHRFECNGHLEWFDGIVLSYNKECEEYRVKYDGEEEVCSYRLLEDLKANDLIISD